MSIKCPTHGTPLPCGFHMCRTKRTPKRSTIERQERAAREAERAERTRRTRNDLLLLEARTFDRKIQAQAAYQQATAEHDAALRLLEGFQGPTL